MAVIKRFKALLHFIDTEYYSGIETVLNGPEMALNEVMVILYATDNQYDENNWGIGI
ncbi:MAG: hypothetical protein ABSF81_18535 [Bacteroidales bacterium]|jgi:hypothetical protein